MVSQAARGALSAARELSDGHGPAIEHGTLAAFIAEGHLARHLRRMRKVYAERRRVLLEALAAHCGDVLQAMPGVAGLHVTALLQRPVDTREVVARAAQAGVAVQDLTGFAADHTPPDGFVLGYGLIEASGIEPAVRELGRAIRTSS